MSEEKSLYQEWHELYLAKERVKAAILETPEAKCVWRCLERLARFLSGIGQGKRQERRGERR